MYLFDVVNNRVNVLVPSGVNSGDREHVEALARSIDGTGTRQPIAVLRAGVCVPVAWVQLAAVRYGPAAGRRL